MNVIENSTEASLEIMPTYLDDSQSSESRERQSSLAGTGNWLTSQPSRHGASALAEFPFASWRGWSSRGIPELASPLAD